MVKVIFEDFSKEKKNIVLSIRLSRFRVGGFDKCFGLIWFVG